MKKILFLLAIVLAGVCVFGQTYDSTITLSTYKTSYTYTFDCLNDEIVKMTPGQLLEQAGKLKNTAITVGLVSTALSVAITIPTACGKISPGAGYAIGSVIGFVGGVTCLALEVKSNKLIKEAGRRMSKIEIRGNGVTIKF